MIDENNIQAGDYFLYLDSCAGYDLVIAKKGHPLYYFYSLTKNICYGNFKTATTFKATTFKPDAIVAINKEFAMKVFHELVQAKVRGLLTESRRYDALQKVVSTKLSIDPLGQLILHSIRNKIIVDGRHIY